MTGPTGESTGAGGWSVSTLASKADMGRASSLTNVKAFPVGGE